MTTSRHAAATQMTVREPNVIGSHRITKYDDFLYVYPVDFIEQTLENPAA